MDFETYLRFILVLVFVLGLVFLLGWILRRSGIGAGAGVGKSRRVGVVESAFLGPKHRLVLVRRDQVEHLVLIGPTSSILVESGITGLGASPSAPIADRAAFRALVKDEIDHPSATAPGERE
jgi:flagellar protein FliO/FliZ